MRAVARGGRDTGDSQYLKSFAKRFSIVVRKVGNKFHTRGGLCYQADIEVTLHRYSATDLAFTAM